MTTLRTCVLLAALSLAAACAGATGGDPTVATGPPTPTGPSATAVATTPATAATPPEPSTTEATPTGPAVEMGDVMDTGPPAPDPNAEQALAEARAAWQAAAPSSYAFVIEYSCFCPTDLLGPYEVTVTDGEVTAVRPDPGPDAEGDFAPATIDGLHDRIAAELASSDTVDVRYDEDGVPVSAMFDRITMAIDDELSFFVTYPADAATAGPTTPPLLTPEPTPAR